MTTRDTISASYLAQQRELHKNPNYGVASLSYAPIVKSIIEQARIKSLSDYGAGKCNLRKGLEKLGVHKLDYFPFDPAFPEYGPPVPSELVCCIDVMEHVEEEFVDAVFSDLQEITTNIGFVSIHTGPAGKFLPDGRNAHIIQKPSSWWLPRTCQYFEVGHLERGPGGFWMILEPKTTTTRKSSDSADGDPTRTQDG